QILAVGGERHPHRVCPDGNVSDQLEIRKRVRVYTIVPPVAHPGSLAVGRDEDAMRRYGLPCRKYAGLQLSPGIRVRNPFELLVSGEIHDRKAVQPGEIDQYPFRGA